MAYDEKVADRLRAAFARALAPTDDIEERKMFGGVAEMVNGHMCVGVIGAELVVHVREADAPDVARRPHVRPMDFTGKPMKAWFYVATPGFATDADLDGFVQTALTFVHEADPKKAGKARPMKAKPTKVKPTKVKPARPNPTQTPSRGAPRS